MDFKLLWDCVLREELMTLCIDPTDLLLLQGSSDSDLEK